LVPLTFVSMFRRTLPLFLVLVPIVARAQTPLSGLVQSGAAIQVPVPPNADRPRLQLLISGTQTVLDDERANVQNGVAVARLEADPGTYDVRVVSNDRARTPLGISRRFLVPGFKREAGRWLFNGSAVVYSAMDPVYINSIGPNLRKDNKKTKLPFVFPTSGMVKWEDVAGVNPILYSDMTPRFVVAESGYASQTGIPYYSSQIEERASSSDAILIKGNDQTLLKIARRNAEETPNFDLPIFAQFPTAPSATDCLQAFQSGASGLIVPEGAANPVLDILSRNSARLSGAVTLEDVGMRAADFERFAPVLRRAGRVPLLARLPGEGNGEKKSDDKLAESLLVAFDEKTDAATLDKIERAAKVGATIYCEGALPPALRARWSEITKVQITGLPNAKKATVSLDEPWFWGTINDQNFDVNQTLTLAVKPSLSSQIKDVKGEAKETVARPIAKFNDDPNAIMLCPIGRGRVIWAPFDVTTPTVIGLETRPTALENRVPATNRITTPAFTRNSSPYNFFFDDSPFAGRAIMQFLGGNYNYIDDSPLPNTSAPTEAALQTAYYSAVAGAMQPALVTYEATRGDASGVSVELRATRADPTDAKSVSATLVSFFNSSNAPVDLDASVRGDGPYVLDLENDQTLPATVRDFSTRVSLTVPANGFRWIVIAKDAQTWQDAGKNSVRARLR